MEKEYKIYQVSAPDSIFKNRENRQNVSIKLTDKAHVYLTTKITAVEGEGVFTYYQGMKSPRIGLSPTYQEFPQIIHEVNKVKRILMRALGVISFHPIQRALEGFNDVAGMCLDPWYLKDGFYSPTARAIYKFIHESLVAYGIKWQTAAKTAETIAMIFECDDAYRYSFEDGMGETTKAKMLKNPRKEIRKVLEIVNSRWTPNSERMDANIRRMRKAVWVLLLIPSVKRAIFKGLASVDFKDWQMTDGDEIQCLRWSSYCVRGRSWEERTAIFQKIYGDSPPQMVEIRVK